MENLIQFPEREQDPIKLIEKMAGSSKLVTLYINHDGECHSFIGDDCSYTDLLFFADSIRRRMDKIFPS